MIIFIIATMFNYSLHFLNIWFQFYKRGRNVIILVGSITYCYNQHSGTSRLRFQNWRTCTCIYICQSTIVEVPTTTPSWLSTLVSSRLDIYITFRYVLYRGYTLLQYHYFIVIRLNNYYYLILQKICMILCICNKYDVLFCSLSSWRIVVVVYKDNDNTSSSMQLGC